jgi:hypothetical protein
MKWLGLEKSPSMQNKDSVVHYVDASYDFIITAIKNLDSNKYGEIVSQQTPGGYRSVNSARLADEGFRTSNPPPWSVHYLYSIVRNSSAKRKVVLSFHLHEVSVQELI